MKFNLFQQPKESHTFIPLDNDNSIQLCEVKRLNLESLPSFKETSNVPSLLCFSKLDKPGFEDIPFYMEDNPDNVETNLRISFQGTRSESSSAGKYEEVGEQDKLYICLTKLIKGEDIAFSDLNFDPIYHKFFSAILLKKTRVKEIEKLFTKVFKKKDEQALDEMNKMIQTNRSKKRAEERCKFVFKMTINSFREKFFKNNKLKKKDSKSEILFWEYYFKDFCFKNKIPVNHIFDPLNRKLVTNHQFKCLNFEYFNIIFRNERFRKIFFLYMEKGLKEDYFSKIMKKFNKLLKGLEKQLQECKIRNRKKVVKEYVKQRIMTRGCKLPWSLNEIDHAIKYFKDYVGKLKRI